MKKKHIRLLILLLTSILIANLACCFASAKTDGDLIILYTNDVHCATEQYPILAAYREQLISEGHTVITVDAGDAIQGEMIGSLTEGAAIVEIMNAVGYDFAIPGNHEFDYKIPTLLTLSEKANYKYLSANFYDLINQKYIFDGYSIIEFNGKKVAFVGISTPETFSKSTPAYFQDENGNFIYSFMQNEFYETIQATIDAAKSEGADTVIALGHLGITGVTEGWRSIDVIQNTEGLDAFIDAHAHETIENSVYTDKNGNAVPLTSTGTKLSYFGQMTITDDGIKTELIDPKTIDVSGFCDSARLAESSVASIIDGYNAEFDYLYEEIGYSEVNLTIYDENGVRAVRSAETNAGNFSADAYRVVLKTDVAFVNGGGVRATVPEGIFNRKAIMDINPWGNEMCILRVTGQQLLDALEYGTHASPNEFGSFPQVSGITFELHRYIESSVVIDELENFISLDNENRRVQNVKINGKPIDLNAEYTIAGSVYMLLENGYTMFKDAEIVARDGLPTDTELLVEYVTNNLNGTLTTAQYGDIAGDGRIKMLDSPLSDEPIVPGDSDKTHVWVIVSVSSLSLIYFMARNNKKLFSF